MNKIIALLIIFCVQFPTFAAEPFGIALALEGEVLVTRGIIEFEAKTEETFFFEDDIETGEDGRVQISFHSSFLSIGPNTVMSLSREVGDNGEDLIIVSLEEGEFRSKINDLDVDQYFEVHSERGKLRVHGTDFVTSYSPDDGDAFGVSVLEGKVGISENTDEDEDEGNGDDQAENDGGGTNSTVSDESNSENNSNNSGGATFVSSNQSSGFNDDGAQDVASMSESDNDNLKSKFPMPGDDEQSPLFFENIGIQNIDVTEIASQVSEQAQLVLDVTQPATSNPVVEAISQLNNDTVPTSPNGFRINFTIDISN